jgi:hypothetical protein
MTIDAKHYLERALSHIAQDNFGRRAGPVVTLSSDTHREADGSLTGALEVRVRRRNGESPLIQRESFTALNSRSEVDDLLARTLSVLLMNHPDWPR